MQLVKSVKEGGIGSKVGVLDCGQIIYIGPHRSCRGVWTFSCDGKLLEDFE